MVSDRNRMMFNNVSLMVCLGLLVHIMFWVWMVFNYGVLFHVRVLLDDDIVLDNMDWLNMTILNHSIRSMFIVVMLSNRC